MRLDNIKNQYKRELIPLTQQRETLVREIADLKTVRDVFLEETTVLNARNEELAQLSAQYARRIESIPESAPLKPYDPKHYDTLQEKRSGSFDKTRPVNQTSQPALPHSLSSSTTGSSAYGEENDPKFGKKTDVDSSTPKKFIKWGSKAKDPVTSIVISDSSNRGRSHPEHTFQQLSVLRFTRCDQCGDKMWGSQLRCSSEFFENHWLFPKY